MKSFCLCWRSISTPLSHQKLFIAQSKATPEKYDLSDDTIDDLTDTFMELYKRFKCEGMKEQKIDLVTILAELKCRQGIKGNNIKRWKRKLTGFIRIRILSKNVQLMK